MTKNTIIGLIILIVVCASLGFYLFKSGSTQSELTKIPEAEKILLYVEDGDVSFKLVGTETFQKVVSSSTVISNQTVVHTDIGHASILLPDNSTISLDNNSEIIVNYSDKKISLYQNFGTTYHRVETLISGKSYEVQTAGTLAAVRGTKFAVNYDLKTKKTKVAVTENKVQVSTIPKVSPGVTAPAEEIMIVEEGKTVSVETVLAVSTEKRSAMKVVNTEDDTEMRAWADHNKDKDDKLKALKEKIKVEKKDKKEYRKEMKKTLFNDDSKEDERDIKEESNEKGDDDEEGGDVVKTETIKATSTIEESKELENHQTSISPTSATIEPAIVIKKIGEEEFFNNFSNLYTKYFYVDDSNSACSLQITPEERVRLVASYATASGYPFTSTGFLAFAKEIESYCSKKDSETKTRLQSRFDEEFPFKEVI